MGKWIVRRIFFSCLKQCQNIYIHNFITHEFVFHMFTCVSQKTFFSGKCSFLLLKKKNNNNNSRSLFSSRVKSFLVSISPHCSHSYSSCVWWCSSLRPQPAWSLRTADPSHLHRPAASQLHENRHTERLSFVFCRQDSDWSAEMTRCGFLLAACVVLVVSPCLSDCLSNISSLRDLTL